MSYSPVAGCPRCPCRLRRCGGSTATLRGCLGSRQPEGDAEEMARSDDDVAERYPTPWPKDPRLLRQRHPILLLPLFAFCAPLELVGDLVPSEMAFFVVSGAPRGPQSFLHRPRWDQGPQSFLHCPWHHLALVNESEGGHRDADPLFDSENQAQALFDESLVLILAHTH